MDAGELRATVAVGAIVDAGELRATSDNTGDTATARRSSVLEPDFIRHITQRSAEIEQAFRRFEIRPIHAQHQLRPGHDGPSHFAFVETIHRYANSMLAENFYRIAYALPCSARIAAEVNHVCPVIAVIRRHLQNLIE